MSVQAPEQRAQKRGLPRAAWSAVQVACTLGLLHWALAHVDRSRFARDKLELGWLSLACACTAPAYAAAALRWSFTAQRIGVALPFKRALREVYLASFINGLLPSGFAGDVLRVARQGRALRHEGQDGYRRALLGVALERFSGQALLWLVLVASLLSWPALTGVTALLPLCALLGALAVFGLGGGRETDSGAALAPTRGQRMLSSARRALIADGALALQLATSALVLLACTLGFACCAKGLSVPLSLLELVRIVPAFLALSALPVSVGGFGVRELASATLYAGSGLDAGTGIAVAGVYGLLNLLGSAPGALIALRSVESAQ